MAELRWTEEAATWLEDIYRYIAQDDPQAAFRVVTAIYEDGSNAPQVSTNGSYASQRAGG